MQDVITRSITVKASKERVFKALTDPEEFIVWFPEAIEGGALEVGQEPIFSFHDGVHKRRVHVEAANPYDYFAYRWAPGDPGLGGGDLSDIPTTLVEFFIEELESGTKVTVKESGFASLPSDYVESAFKENTGGWGFVMERFETMLNSF